MRYLAGLAISGLLASTALSGARAGDMTAETDAQVASDVLMKDCAAGLQEMTARAARGDRDAMEVAAAFYAKDGALLIKQTLPKGSPDCAQVTPDSKAEIRWLTMAASKGSAGAERALAKVYSAGVDAPVDQDKFDYWVTKAADDGSADAQQKILDDFRVDKFDLVHREEITPKTILWLQEMADSKDSYAEVLLGGIYTVGVGAKPDLNRALPYFQKAADLGNPKAETLLGYLYQQGYEQDGKSIAKDGLKATLLFQAAAKQGNAEASYQAGLMFLQSPDIKDDPVEANTYFSSAANAGLTRAQYQLARDYQSGTGVTQSDAEAFQWFSKAAAGGSSLATGALATAYAEGKGVAPDDAQAFAWAAEGVKEKDPESTFEMGVLIADGRGTKQDLPLAQRFLQEADEEGFPQAKAEIAAVKSQAETQAASQASAAQASSAQDAQTQQLVAQHPFAALFMLGIAASLQSHGSAGSAPSQEYNPPGSTDNSTTDMMQRYQQQDEEQEQDRQQDMQRQEEDNEAQQQQESDTARGNYENSTGDYGN
jgi:TPR repeat protein